MSKEVAMFSQQELERIAAACDSLERTFTTLEEVLRDELRSRDRAHLTLVPTQAENEDENA
jgi:hypothetical protein